MSRRGRFHLSRVARTTYGDEFDGIVLVPGAAEAPDHLRPMPLTADTGSAEDRIGAKPEAAYL